MLPRSLRWQIQLWHASLLVVLIGAVLVSFYGYERRARIARIDAELTAPLVALLPRHVRLPGRARPPAASPRDNLEREFEASGHYILVFNSAGETVYASPGAPDNTSAVEREGDGPVMRGRWNGAHRELVNMSPRGDLVILARTDTRLAAELRTFALKLAALGLGVVSLGLAGGYFISNRTLRPIRSIASAARRVAAGGWHERIPAGPAPAEIDELRAVLNESFERIAAAYEQQRRFTADASHELGTPVAVVIAKTQHALARPRSNEDYVAALAACRRAGERMRALTRDLFDLAAYDNGSAAVRLVECDLSEIAREALKLVGPLAAERQSALAADLKPALVLADPVHLGRVLVNLLNNAIKHNSAGVRASISLRRAGSRAEVVVADDGRGIPPDALPLVFDRFYRADAARTRAEGGGGLGLSIAREIVRLHHGEITAANAPAGGAVFTVTLPLASE